MEQEKDTQLRIFEGALVVFAQKGFERATVDEIAERSQVAKGTVYYYFKGKEELYLFLLSEGLDLLEQEVLAAVSRESGARERICALVRAQLDFFRRYQDLYHIILSEAWGAEQRRRVFQQRLGQYLQKVEQLVQSGIQEGELRPLNAETMTSALFGMISIASLRSLVRHGDIPVERLTQELTGIFFTGAAGGHGREKHAE